MGFLFDSFATIFIVAVVIVGLGFVAVIVLVARNAAAASRSGHDPTTMQTELMGKLLDSEALRGERTPEERLAQLDSLLAARSISPAEHAEARRRVLGEL